MTMSYSTSIPEGHAKAIVYTVTIYGNGWAIAVKGGSLDFFAQDDDAEEYVNLWNEEGFEGLIPFLLLLDYNDLL